MKYYRSTEGKLFAYESDGSQDDFVPTEYVLVSEDEALAIIAGEQTQIQNAINSNLTYAQRRAVAYPPIGDQLDALWKGGEAAAEMLAKIQAVKAAYPKGQTTASDAPSAGA